jgi:omega-6 fatty acid desaturase (delta-12 desaturase)
MPARDQDPELDGPHEMFEDAPLYVLYKLFIMLVFGWPFYLFNNSSGQKYSGWASHFNPFCAIYDSNQVFDVLSSTGGVVAMIGLLSYCGQLFGSWNVVRYYLLPYLCVNFWLVLITYLQHTHPDLPHYREAAWNFQRGAALTIDRPSFGLLLNHFHHHISDTHVAHHFFSTMPHYHAQEATQHIKKVLGKHYQTDDTPIHIALWNTWKHCRFVEDEGDVVFYKH